jgi:2'-deoxynucleoside 5'-phosphate N-hydrolase
MKIYFSGSIRGGRDYKELYLKIVEWLRAYGTVLTEHVADVQLSSYGEHALSDEAIYARDMAWLNESDVVVAEVSVPSLGVGYELGEAVRAQKPTLCFFRAGSEDRLSAMVSGSPGIKVVTYKTEEDIKNAIGTYLENIPSRVARHAARAQGARERQ